MRDEVVQNYLGSRPYPGSVRRRVSCMHSTNSRFLRFGVTQRICSAEITRKRILESFHDSDCIAGSVNFDTEGHRIDTEQPERLTRRGTSDGGIERDRPPGERDDARTTEAKRRGPQRVAAIGGRGLSGFCRSL